MYGARLRERVEALDVEAGDTAGLRSHRHHRTNRLPHDDYELRLYNGDTGVIIESGSDHVRAAFERGTELLEFAPTRLGAIETAFAMTIHRSQGSQFDTAVVLLPAATSRILTRELLYTAVTRARQRLVLVGSEEAIRAAVSRPVARASGLQARMRSGRPR